MDILNKLVEKVKEGTKYYHVVGEGDLDDFLRKHKPSIIEISDAPWIWCGDGKGDSEDHAVAVSRGADILEGLVDQLKVIELPVRAKKGQTSKKAARDAATVDATAALKALSLETGYTHGKWLLYPSHEAVDAVWARVARSVAQGPLRAAGADGAKVATTSDPDSSHVICVYYDDVYDKDKSENILRALLDHGLEPSAVKSDLYTVIGLDSKHSSKMRSSIWRPTDFMTKDDVKAIQASWSKDKEKQLYADLKANSDGKKVKRADADKPPVVQSAETKEVKRSLPLPTTPKPKRVKSKARAFRDEDVFVGSD